MHAVFAIWFFGAGVAVSADIDLRQSEGCDPASRPADTTAFFECAEPQIFPAPNGKMEAVVQRGVVLLRRAGKTYEVAKASYGHLVWRPDSSGFALADSEGSGQTSIFSYLNVGQNTPELTVALAEAAIRRFGEMNNCAGPAWHANVFVDGWTAAGAVRLVVQDGLHSEGCRRSADVPQIGVVGDPVSGTIAHVLTGNEVKQLWCSAEQRRAFGYCYVEKAER